MKSELTLEQLETLYQEKAQQSAEVHKRFIDNLDKWNLSEQELSVLITTIDQWKLLEQELFELAYKINRMSNGDQ